MAGFGIIGDKISASASAVLIVCGASEKQLTN
jgi:hypothetical protein